MCLLRGRRSMAAVAAGVRRIARVALQLVAAPSTLDCLAAVRAEAGAAVEFPRRRVDGGARELAAPDQPQFLTRRRARAGACSVATGVITARCQC